MAATTISRYSFTEDTGDGVTGDIITAALIGTSIYDKIDALLAGALVVGSTLGVTGALTVTAGQIVFPGTQNASSNVNTLDDYEEGTWTPSITSAGGGAATYTAQHGYYVKVGKLVTAQGYIQLATKGTLGAGNASIAGLPFALGSNTNEYGVLNMPYWAGMTTALMHMGGFAAPSATTVLLIGRATAGTTITVLTVADLGATVEIIFTITYRAGN